MCIRDNYTPNPVGGDKDSTGKDRPDNPIDTKIKPIVCLLYTSFMENALLKARYYAKATNRSCLADDSGITVDVLNGAPGVYSARYAGRHGDDNANNEKLIRELQGKSNRTGHYVCALALVYPDGREVTAEGYCDCLLYTSRCV